ncbi:hypothetical protein ACIRVK_37350 [Streptomyces sp. NPDC101152]|uniref:cupin domain-containing protein n=1 Tax=Streptomyces sp. NPDC101152 TaxID=3366116 RepID=UPI003821E6E9
MRIRYYDLRLEVAGPASGFATRLDVVELGALTVGDVRFGTEMRMSFGEPGVYHVAVPFSGCFSIQEGRGEVELSTPGRALVFDPARDIHIDTWSADCQALTVKIDKAAVPRRATAGVPQGADAGGSRPLLISNRAGFVLGRTRAPVLGLALSRFPRRQEARRRTASAPLSRP